MKLHELAKASKEFEQQFLDNLPLEAWQFFGKKPEIHGGFVHLSDDGDSFLPNDPDFKKCLEFWVDQLGGVIKWKK